MEISEIENRKTVEKIDKTESWFFKNIDKTDDSNKTDKEIKKEDKNYQYQEWNRGYHYRPHRYQKFKKTILPATLHT